MFTPRPSSIHPFISPSTASTIALSDMVAEVEDLCTETFDDESVDDESVDVATETFEAWRTLRPTEHTGYMHNTPFFKTQLTEWVTSTASYIYLILPDANITHHAVLLFLRYINVPSVYTQLSRLDPYAQWNSLAWHRVGCLWLALKMEDANFDDLSCILTEEDMVDSPKLISAELQIIQRLEYNVSAMRDYISILGTMLTIPEEVLTGARGIQNRMLSSPELWYGTSHATICAACIIVAREILGGDRSFDTHPESYVCALHRLNIAPIPRMYELADGLLNMLL